MVTVYSNDTDTRIRTWPGSFCRMEISRIVRRSVVCQAERLMGESRPGARDTTRSIARRGGFVFVQGTDVSGFGVLC